MGEFLYNLGVVFPHCAFVYPFTFNISVICFRGFFCMQYMFGFSFCDPIYKTLIDYFIYMY